eukprot:scaffold160441_cov32-Tisochrysis_lutea.AAC.2
MPLESSAPLLSSVEVGASSKRKRCEPEDAVSATRKDRIDAIPSDTKDLLMPFEVVQGALRRTCIPQADTSIMTARDQKMLASAAPQKEPRGAPPLERTSHNRTKWSECPVATMAEPRETSTDSTALPQAESVATSDDREASHSRTLPSHEAEYSSDAVLHARADTTSVWPPSSASGATSTAGAAVGAGAPLLPRARLVGCAFAAGPVASSAGGRKMQIRLSHPPDARASDAGLAMTDSTEDECPRHISWRTPSADQTLTIPSLPAPTGRLPSHATALIGATSSPAVPKMACCLPLASHR